MTQFTFPGIHWLKAPNRETAVDTAKIEATVAQDLADATKPEA